MIYVGISPFVGEDENFSRLIKIGYTKDENRDKRLQTYIYHNPGFKFIYEFMGGTEDQEHRLHYKFKKYLHHGNEWFTHSENILEYFKTATLEDFSKLPINPNFIGSTISNDFSLEVQVMLENILVFLEGVTWRDFIENRGLLRDRFSSIIPDNIKKVPEETWNWLISSGHFPKLQDNSLEDFWKPITNDEVHKFHKIFESLSIGQEKMKYLCEFLNYRKNLAEEALISVPLAYKNYYTVLGSERCRQIGYQMSKLEKEYQKQLNNQRIPDSDLLQLIYSSFKEGDRFSNTDLKLAVQGIYNHLGLKKTGKARDMEQWFEIKKCLVTNPQTKKRENGIELIKRKY